MSDLKPCPFCGGKPEKMTSDDGFTSIGCFHCNPFWGVMVQGTNELDTIDVWNTRVERTCRIEGRYGNQYCTCCGEMIGTWDSESELYISSNMVELWNYCPNCGARVGV